MQPVKHSMHAQQPHMQLTAHHRSCAIGRLALQPWGPRPPLPSRAWSRHGPGQTEVQSLGHATGEARGHATGHTSGCATGHATRHATGRATGHATRLLGGRTFRQAGTCAIRALWHSAAGGRATPNTQAVNPYAVVCGRALDMGCPAGVLAPPQRIPLPTGRRRRAHACCPLPSGTSGTEGGHSVLRSPGIASPQPWRVVAGVASVTMLLFNLHRSNFTMAVPIIAERLALSPPQVGLLNSAMLGGYLVGQLPAGFLSDRCGGERVLLPCLLLWSAALLASAATIPAAPSTLTAGAATAMNTAAAAAAGMASGSVSGCWAGLLASRFAFGLCTAAAMPSVSALAASWVPPHSRASALAGIYTMFNVGGVVGLWLTPLLLTAAGVQTTLQYAAAVGATWGTTRLGSNCQLLTLCWCHAVIGWGFFITAAWLPLYLRSLGLGSLAAAGALSALPYVATAMATAAAGAAADRLLHSGLPLLAVRRIMHAVSTLGCAACVAPLALWPSPSPYLACLWLVGVQCCYAASFGGFHPYVQDVASADAGLMLGITNSCSILMGILGNLATGHIVSFTGSYQSVFGVTALLYLSSFAAFMVVLRGGPMRLRTHAGG